MDGGLPRKNGTEQDSEDRCTIPKIGTHRIRMYGICPNIWGILMVNVTIYIHIWHTYGSYGYQKRSMTITPPPIFLGPELEGFPLPESPGQRSTESTLMSRPYATVMAETCWKTPYDLHGMKHRSSVFNWWCGFSQPSAVSWGLWCPLFTPRPSPNAPRGKTWSPPWWRLEDLPKGNPKIEQVNVLNWLQVVDDGFFSSGKPKKKRSSANPRGEDTRELELHATPKKMDNPNLKNCLLSGPVVSELMEMELEVQYLWSPPVPGQPIQLSQFQMSSIPWVQDNTFCVQLSNSQKSPDFSIHAVHAIFPGNASRLNIH